MNLERCEFCLDAVFETFDVRMYDSKTVHACRKFRGLIADVSTNLEVRVR